VNHTCIGKPPIWPRPCSAAWTAISAFTPTIVITFYNAPRAQQLRAHYKNLPEKLQAEGVRPNIPWLYDFKLDFRFK